MDSSRTSEGVSGGDVARQPTRSERLLYRVVRGLVVGFCRTFWRLEVRGLENVPTDRPFVLSAVHRSNVDSLVVAAVTKRRLRYMGKHTMWKYDLPGRFFTAMGGFPVHRGAADREALRNCEQVLAAGEPVVMFPEGQRRTGSVVEELFEGPSFVAARAQVPILPIGIGGSDRAMAPGSGMIRPARITMVIGEPIEPAVADNGKRPSRKAVHAVTETLRTRIQALYDEAQEMVGRPNPPRGEHDT